MGNMSIKAEQPHGLSFAQTLLFVKKSFTKVSYNTLSNTSTIHDFADVAFMSMTMDHDYFCISLSGDGMNCVIYAAMPEMFGEVKRLKKQMKDNWTPINPCVLAHDDCVQEIRKTNKAKGGKFWGTEPQVIPLPFKCEGSPTKSCNFLKLGSVNGQTQYALVISLNLRKQSRGWTKRRSTG